MPQTGHRYGTQGDDSPADPDGLRFDEAFAELRPAMFALAYRITGSRADAEEIVQDAFVRLYTAEQKEAVRSLKAYLATITARLSLNRLRDRQARRETYIGEWLPEPLPTAGLPAMGIEELSFALMAVLERLSPLERVVFVLHNAFDLTFEEIAPVAGRNAVNCRKIFSRAKARIREERPRFSIDRERHRALLLSFDQAARSGDTAKLISLLDESVVFHGDDGGKGYAPLKPIVGNVAVANFMIATTARQPAGIRVEETELNGAPALALKINGRLVVVLLIETDGDRIHAIYAIGNASKLLTIQDAGPAPRGC